MADRVVMLYPLARLDADEPQIVFDGTPEELMRLQGAGGPVRWGEAGERLEGSALR